MRLLVVIVGKDLRDPLKQVAESYLERTQPSLKPHFIYVRESKRRENQALAMDEEAKEILKVTTGHHRIAMDIGGKMYSSIGMAEAIQKHLNRSGLPISFIIGGATGLSEKVIEQCQERWSLSSLTLPHRLAYLVLAEQIYRAGEILRGGPYHK